MISYIYGFLAGMILASCVGMTYLIVLAHRAELDWKYGTSTPVIIVLGFLGVLYSVFNQIRHGRRQRQDLEPSR